MTTPVCGKPSTPNRQMMVASKRHLRSRSAAPNFLWIGMTNQGVEEAKHQGVEEVKHNDVEEAKHQGLPEAEPQVQTSHGRK